MSDKSQIKVSCTDQVLKITESPVLASGGLSEVRVVFTFCDKWAGFAKTAIFYRDIEDPYFAVLDENDTCIVPWEVCYEEGAFFFGVFGEKGTTRRTSVMMRYKTKSGAITTEMMPSDPTPDVYDQIMAMLAEIRGSQGTFIEDAETAIQNANTAAQNAQIATSNTNTATENANTATASALQATESANTAANNANTEAGKATQATTDANAATTNANNAASDARTATEETNAARESLMQAAGDALETIKEVVQDGEDAPPIVCSADGEVITVNDSADRLVRGLSLYGKTEQFKTTGKNLLKYTENIGTNAGVTFTVDSNGIISASGTPSAIFAESIYGDYSTPIAFPAGDYIISGGVDKDHYLRVRIHNPDGTFKVHIYATDTEKSFTIEDGELVSVSIYFATLTAVSGMKFYPMIRLASVADATYEPYTGGAPSPSPDYPQDLVSVGDSGSVVVSTNTPNNLLPAAVVKEVTQHGLTFASYSDGSYTIKGTKNVSYASSVYFPLPTPVHFPASGSLTWQDRGNTALSSFSFAFHTTLANGNYSQLGFRGTYGSNQDVNFLKGKTVTAISLYVANSEQIDLTMRPSIRYVPSPNNGSIDFVESQYQSLAASTPNGLPGIPVSSGGNYTDASGQQWICDEVDFARGVHVQRIGKIDSYASDEIPGEYMSTTGELSDGATVIYTLAESIETALSEEDLAAYAALHTCHPNTMVWNDANAHMSVNYVTDTKTYIDRDINAISEDINAISEDVNGISAAINLKKYDNGLYYYKGKQVTENPGVGNTVCGVFYSTTDGLVFDAKADKKYIVFIQSRTVRDGVAIKQTISCHACKTGTSSRYGTLSTSAEYSGDITYSYNELTVPNDARVFYYAHIIGGEVGGKQYEFSLEKVFLLEVDKDSTFDYKTYLKTAECEKTIFILEKEEEPTEEEPTEEEPTEIVCWGDSQTGGGHNSTTQSYPYFLQELLGDVYTVRNYGNGGENINAIAYRVGTLPLYIQPFTLPAGAGTTAITMQLANNRSLGNLFRAWNSANPVKVGGVSCYIYDNGKIQRVTAGTEAITFDRPVKALPPAPVKSKNAVHIFQVGANGGFSGIDEYLDMLKSMVNAISGIDKKYIVICPWHSYFHENFDGMEYNDISKRLYDAFGEHFLDIRSYLVNYGLADNNLTATETDTANIADNIVPTSIRYDGVHMNQYGYSSQAKKVYQFGKDLGYWD